MYCKEKIYAGTQEFSFEELRAARIFSKIRDGTYTPPVIEKQPENVRYMYPKKEVYSLLEGEFQYEEILARRYFARLKKQGTSTNPQQGAQKLSFGNVSSSTQQLAADQSLCRGDEPCAMEIGSCQKNVVRTSSAAATDGYLNSMPPSHSRCIIRFSLQVWLVVYIFRRLTSEFKRHLLLLPKSFLLVMVHAVPLKKCISCLLLVGQ